MKVTGIVAFISLTITFMANGQTDNEIDSSYTCIQGTKLCFVIPDDYYVANKFAGIKNPANGSFIMISEMENPLDIIKKEFTAKRFVSEGMELIDTDEYKLGKYNGVLYKASKQTEGLIFGKWILIIGNENFSTMINGTFPSGFDSEVSEIIKKCILSVKINDSLEIDPEKSVAFKVNVEKTKLKFAKLYAGTLIYTVDGVYPINSLDPVSFKVGSSLGMVNIENPYDFALDRLNDLPYKIEPHPEVRPVKINDLSGYEIIAYGKDSNRNSRILIYQVVLFGSGSYYIMVGSAFNDFDKNSCLFSDIAFSFKRESRR